jgi:hypothetical protein
MQRAEVVREAGTVPSRSHWRELRKNPALVVWVLFLMLSPLYVFNAGMPQPGDWLVLVLVPATLFSWKGTLDRQSTRTVRALLWFTFWVFVVNYAWALVLGKWKDPKDFILHPFFYFFNSAVFLCSLILARRNREAFLRITAEVVFGTVVVIAVSSFVYRTDYYRGQVFFNSPNQLGFYALLSACLFAMVQRPLGISRIKAAIGVTACAYLAVLSASRASAAGILVLLFVLLFSNPRTIIIASIAAVGLVSVGGPIANAIEVSQTRATHDRDPKMSFASERGYDRIWHNPEYLITGAGEGGYERFVGPGESRRELHSSFGTVVFGYGIVGILLFTTFAARVVRGAPLRMSLMLLPALVFTVAHQGLRFTMFWVVLAAFAVLKTMPSSEKKAQGDRTQART